MGMIGDTWSRFKHTVGPQANPRGLLMLTAVRSLLLAAPPPIGLLMAVPHTVASAVPLERHDVRLVPGRSGLDLGFGAGDRG